MARMTLTQAATKARELQASVRRLESLYHGEVTAHHGTKVGLDQQRQQRNGRKHELDTLVKLTADLVAGLSGIGPARDGQLGGQRQGGMATSAAAVELVAPRAGTQRDQLLRAFLGNLQSLSGPDWAVLVGLTDVDLAKRTSLPANSVRPRRVELVDAGWLENSGRTKQHNGRDHTVWALTEAARERLQTGDTGT